jgi:hypothetical protein
MSDYSHYTEPPKLASKMSFYSEESAAAVNRIPNATPRMLAAARRVIAKLPDADVLGAMIFGDLA